jgi:glycosyltransferase involved in cell wall biosynthesis
VSAQQREEIYDIFAVGRREQFAVIPLGLDLSQFASWRYRGRKFREEIGAKPDDILIGIVGRLTEVKNHQLFFEAIRLFRESDPTNQSVRFVVIGDGALRQELENQLERLALKPDVIFVGNRSDPEDFYPALDIVALTSRNEGTPLTLLEAMANVRPIIATGVGGVTDLLGEVACETQDGFSICQRGLRVSPGDAQSFAAGLARLIGDANLRSELGERGLEFVEQNYSKERLLNDVSSLYRELMEALNCQDLLNRQDAKNAKKTKKANNAEKVA